MKIPAPAKINLHLAVLGRRQDGFHNLESVFLALDFGDTLHFRPISGKNTVEIAMEGEQAANLSLPVEKNIIFRALSLFREKTGFDQGLRITVEKRIPTGGGLGGGSSDAASTLLALNALAGSPLPREALPEMAACLGSDVPFFVHETTAALVTGRGDQIRPLEPPPICRGYFVLVNPGFPSDTAAAFRLLDEHRPDTWIAPVVPDTFCNDFLRVFPEPEKSVYQNIISQLQELGADFASLSGSGSTCFGAFREKPQAEKAAALLRGKWSFVELTKARIFN